MPIQLRDFVIFVASVFLALTPVFAVIVGLQYQNLRLALELLCLKCLLCLLQQVCLLAFSKTWSFNLVPLLLQPQELLMTQHLPVPLTNNHLEVAGELRLLKALKVLLLPLHHPKVILFHGLLPGAGARLRAGAASRFPAWPLLPVGAVS